MIELDPAICKGKSDIAKGVSSISQWISYADTAYHLPITYAITGLEVHTPEQALDAFKKYQENTLIGTEILVASDEVNRKEPEGYTGFIEDTIIRKLGYTLVDGSILGLCLIVGKPSSSDSASSICRELQEKLILTFLAGDVIDNLRSSGVKVGLDYRLVPLGKNPIKGVHFVNILARVALIFGGVIPGDVHRLIAYASERAKAFIIVYPGLTDVEIAFLDGLRILGIPIIQVGEYFGGEWKSASVSQAVQIGMDLRGIKVQVSAIPIPMACSPAFEGKSVRKEDMYAEFGGGRSPAFELLRMRPIAEITDRKVSVIGPEIDQIPIKSAAPLGIIIEVAGKNMKKDFEPVLERRIHNFINYGEGSWHVAQRDNIWVRLTKEAVEKGVKISHLGTLLISKFMMDFPSLLDAVQVTLITDTDKVLTMKNEADEIYAERDKRIAGMKDEDVELFYSCTLCQTFAPNHVCVMTPERPALCGAITWLDGKTAYEIAPSGANQPIEKGTVINKELGEFEGVNKFVAKASHGAIDRCVLYSIMDAPMTCCGCFEAIAMILPEVNGIMIVNREYKGETPSGMGFSTLAGTIGGGAQTPGFIGISKTCILSDRFIQGEGGINRLVWMPSILKEELKDKLMEKFEKMGFSSLFDKIADETIASTIDDLSVFLTNVDHPALLMDPLL